MPSNETHQLNATLTLTSEVLVCLAAIGLFHQKAFFVWLRRFSPLLRIDRGRRYLFGTVGQRCQFGNDLRMLIGDIFGFANVGI